MTRASIFAGFVLLAGCSSPVDGSTSVQVDEVTFSPGCGVKPESDCAFGFVMSYLATRQGVQTSVSHATDNEARTLDITVEATGGNGTGALMDGHASADLGLLDAKPGQTYAVTVYDHDHVVLWSGSVETLYHL